MTKIKLPERPASGTRTLRPRAALPSDATLRAFSDTDRQTLQRLLEARAECIYHPTFRAQRTPRAAVGFPAGADDGPGPADGAAPGGVLTAGQEQAMFLRFNLCRCQVMRILKRSAGRRLDARRARALLQWHYLGQQMRSEIVQRNTSLVLAMARRTRVSAVEMGELVGEGNLALLRCVDKFDVARGFKFSTYACRAILASFSRAAAVGTRYRVRFPASFDPSLERSDHLETKRAGAELACVEELKRILFENVAHLSQVERAVLDSRFALNAVPAIRLHSRASRRTLNQVGALLGVSKERVRQIQNEAMRKLRLVLDQSLSPTGSARRA